MAGKKGMKQARPRTQEERDNLALLRIEQVYDTQVHSLIICPECNAKHEFREPSAVQAKMLADRYRTLRPTLASTDMRVQTSTYADDILKLQQADPVGIAPVLHSDGTDKPVTH